MDEATAAPGARGEEWRSAVGEMKARLEREDYEGMLALGMPAYRGLALGRYGLPSLSDYARNVAVISRARRETVAVLSRWGGPGGEGGVVDGRLLYRSLTLLGRPQPLLAAGLTEEELEFFSLLYTAVARANLRAVLAQVEKTGGPRADEYLFAYVLGTLDASDMGGSLRLLPERLRSMPALGAFTATCAALGRREVAAGTYRVLADEAEDVAVCEEFCARAAEEYLGLGDTAHAIEATRVLVSRFPSSAQAEQAQWRIVELNADRHKAYGTAVEECRRFLELFPASRRCPEIKLRIGGLYYRNGEHDRAIQYLEGLAADPLGDAAAVEIKFLKAICFLGKGETRIGINLLEGLLEEDPKHVLAPRAMLVLAHTRLSLQEYSKAEEMLKKLIARYPRSEYAEKARELADALGRVEQQSRESPAR
jgi:TolA-binding protein